MKKTRRSSYIAKVNLNLEGAMAERFAARERCDWVIGSERGFTGAAQVEVCLMPCACGEEELGGEVCGEGEL